MPVRRRGNKLERWEIALIKAMVSDGRWPNDQDILAYFTRPTRSINHRAIAEIRTGSKHAALNSASPEELEQFLFCWPDIDPDTGLNVQGDELLIKAREAMIAAVHIFNSAGLRFRSELFIVTSIIAWTYLLHAWFKRNGIDYKYVTGKGAGARVQKTPKGADRYWDLSKCLNHPRCPLPKGATDNLKFLIEIRHEIEHRSTSRVDDFLSAKLQACCINFNDLIKSEFGSQFTLEKRLPIALQFVSFTPDQSGLLKGAKNLPNHIMTTMTDFEHRLTPEQQADPRYAFRMLMDRRTANREPSSDLAVELIPPGSEIDEKIAFALKEVEKNKHRPSDIVRKMNEEGFPRFNMRSHTLLWKKLHAKDPAKGYGAVVVGDQWCWYDTWLLRVREECTANQELYN